MRSIGKSLTLVIALLLTAGAFAQKLQVVATTADLGSIATRLGGDLINVEVLSTGDQDAHRVAAKPSLLLKLRRADILFEIGLDLEHAWLPALLEASKNKKIQPGSEGFVNVSEGIKPLDVPKSTDRSQGLDLHPRGNPHYNLDPEGGRTMARNIAKGLIRALPDSKARIEKELAAFEKDLDQILSDLAPKLAALKGRAFVVRHGFFTYLAERFGMLILADLEPIPGSDPSPAHIAQVVASMRRCKTLAILVPPWKTDGVTESVSKTSGVPVLSIPMGSTGRSPDTDYLAWLRRMLETITGALPAPPAK